MRKITSLILILVSTIISAQTLSFDEAVTRLKEGNRKLKGMKKQQEAKEFAVKSMQGMQFPELTLNGSYVYMKDDLYLDLNGQKSMVKGMFDKYSPMFGQMKGQFAKTLEAFENFQKAQAPLKKMQLEKLVKSGNPKLIALAQQIQKSGQQFALETNKLKQIGKLAGQTQFGKGILEKDWRYKFQDQQITRFSLDLKYPIFTGGKIKTGVKVKKLQAEIAKNEFKKTKGILMTKLAERYYQTQLAEEVIKVRQEALESAQKHLYNATKMEENGMLAPVQTMLAKTAVADAEREVMGAQKDAELAETALQGLIGPLKRGTKLTSFLFKIKSLNSLEYYQNLAMGNYPDIVKAQIKKQLTEQNIKYQKANYIPDVAIIGKKYIYTKNLPLTEPDDWYIGVGLKMNLFNGLKNIRKHQEAKAMDESVALLIGQAQIDIQTLVKKYYTEILKQQEQLASLEQSLVFAKELVRVRTKAFKENFATSTDVADANLYLSSIKIKLLKAFFEIDRNLAKLLEICGESETFTQYM